jgi:biopolymer transport protein ExbD
VFFQKKQESNSGIREVNMTPLIDVSLVLVVMLMLATPLAFESSIAIRKAAQSAKKAETDTKRERIEVHILSDEEVRLNRNVVTRADLSDAIAPLIESSSDRLVVVSCADNVSCGAFVNVLDQAKLAGAGEIAVTGK